MLARRRYLYTELGDNSFGQRALYVLGKFNDAKPSAEQSSIPDQILLMARLRHMVSELKVYLPLQTPTSWPFRASPQLH